MPGLGCQWVQRSLSFLYLHNLFHDEPETACWYTIIFTPNFAEQIDDSVKLRHAQAVAHTRRYCSEASDRLRVCDLAEQNVRRSSIVR